MIILNFFLMPNFCNVLMIPNSLRNLVFDAIQVYEFHVQEEDPNSVKPPLASCSFRMAPTRRRQPHGEPTRPRHRSHRGMRRWRRSPAPRFPCLRRAAASGASPPHIRRCPSSRRRPRARSKPSRCCRREGGTDQKCLYAGATRNWISGQEKARGWHAVDQGLRPCRLTR